MMVERFCSVFQVTVYKDNSARMLLCCEDGVSTAKCDSFAKLLMCRTCGAQSSIISLTYTRILSAIRFMNSMASVGDGSARTQSFYERLKIDLYNSK